MKTTEKLLAAGLIISIVVPVFILGTYWYKFDSEISNKAADWSGFGAVLGGSFTLLGSLSTLLTLIFLYQQQRAVSKTQKAERKNAKKFQVEQLKAIKAQTASLTFQQYTEHLRLFGNFISTTGKLNRVELKDADTLYKQLFPQNRPTSCTLVASKLNKHGSPSLLGKCEIGLAEIRVYLRNPEKQTDDNNLIKTIYSLNTILGIKKQTIANHASITITDRPSGLTILRLKEHILTTTQTLSDIAFFGGYCFDDIESDLIDWTEVLYQTTNILFAHTPKSVNDTQLHTRNRGVVGLRRIYEIIGNSDRFPDLLKVINFPDYKENLISATDELLLIDLGKRIASALIQQSDYEKIKSLPETQDIIKELTERFGLPSRLLTR